uniref:hypothetical protein n=1 Tax=Alistipes sp. TaxID=1872444 RepID=UPI004056DE65
MKDNTAIELKERKLPFAEYIYGLPEGEAVLLKREMERRAGFSAPMTSRYLHGTVRPGMLQRREIASVIREHSGDKRFTGDNLFPVEFYNNRS